MALLSTERHGAVQTTRLDDTPYDFLTSTLMSELPTQLTTAAAIKPAKRTTQARWQT